jgi:hypothetical protein
MIDVTECPIWTPLQYEWEYYSVKTKSHTLKYELAISMNNHRILWVNGPYKGSVHDSKIIRDKFLKALTTNERAIADKGYIGVPGIIAPFKPARSPEQKQFNLNHYTVRQSIERCNKRVKQFMCFRQKWRIRGLLGFKMHKWAFYVVCYITQLQFLEKPLTRKK